MTLKKQKGFTLIELIAVGLLLPWLISIYQLSNCDFKSDYKCEATHGIGVFVPPTAIVTVWFDTDE